MKPLALSQLFETYADEADGALNLALENLMQLEEFCLKVVVPYLDKQRRSYDTEAMDIIIDLNNLLEGFDE